MEAAGVPLRTAAGRVAVPPAPPRIQRPGPFAYILFAGIAAFVIHAYMTGSAVSPSTIIEGVGPLTEFIADAFPPDLERAGPIASALVETFEIALVGTIFGTIIAVPLAVLAARNTTPNRAAYAGARGLIALMRTIPDIVWGLIFVVTVGLGPPAGVLAITMDVAGFSGRFFADSIEDVDQGLIDGLAATGASPTGIVAGAVVPSVTPAWTATSMFSLEQATRSSVVLGIVGAGGIGVELTTSMSLLRYDEAATIILAIFIVVLGVERLSSAVRSRIR
ncbi:MAG: phosphonate ABC transporter, permease protein PhnE [Actinobacteria bacterium]|nr:phosphonate ABC transporter, permease protein PhnE [Actinomycetota bacterium]